MFSFIMHTAPIALIVSVLAAEPPAPKLPDLVVEIQETTHNVTKTVDLRAMKKARVGGLMAQYFGVGNQLPNYANINFSRNLRQLWNKKLSIDGVTPSAQKSANRIISRYVNSDPDKKSVKTFIHQINQQALLAQQSISYPLFCQRIRLNREQCTTLKQVAGRIRGKNLAAYGMTELFPSRNGHFNYVTLDTLLRNAGENYLNSIPALGDRLMSVGFYQFTSFAIRHDETTVEGANVVNLFVSDRGAIPGSVVKLTSQQAHRAALYFAVYNLSRLTRTMSARQLATLRTRCSTGEITQFVATAHHLPTLAIKKAAIWVDNDCKKPYISYLGPSLNTYATKTKNNLEELNRRI